MATIPLYTVEDRKKFLSNHKEGMYGGTNSDGEEVLVFVGDGNGFETWTIHKEKPNWFEIISYDNEGQREGVTYKRAQ